MAGFNAAEIRSLPDFAPSYEWKINMVTEPTGIEMPQGSRFNHLCKSSTIPKAQPVTTKEVVLHNHKTVRPGTEFRNGEITLTYTELVTNEVTRMIASWRELNRDPETGQAKVDYQNAVATITLTRYDRIGNPIYKYTLYNVWITDHDFGTELNEGEDSSGFEGITITLSYDDFKEESLV
ncbi:hypothetical protein [Vibrio phage Va2]|nr:hypothetical protein [Vibrio phage Va2]